MDYHELSKNNIISYKKSGFVLTGILFVIYIFFILKGNNHHSLLVMAILIAILAQIEAKPLRKVVDLSIHIGNIMHKVTNPLLFGAIFILAVLPTSLALKLSGKDILKINLDKKRLTYWESRPRDVNWVGTFKNQF